MNFGEKKVKRTCYRIVFFHKFLLTSFTCLSNWTVDKRSEVKLNLHECELGGA